MIAAVVAKTADISLGNPWENGMIKSISARLREELLDGHILCDPRQRRRLASSGTTIRYHYDWTRRWGRPVAYYERDATRERIRELQRSLADDERQAKLTPSAPDGQEAVERAFSWTRSCYIANLYNA